MTAWRRLKNDRVGVVSLVIVAAFALLVLLSFLGIVAGDWQKEVAVPDAPPTFLGPASRADGYRSAGECGCRKTRSRST